MEVIAVSAALKNILGKVTKRKAALKKTGLDNFDSEVEMNIEKEMGMEVGRNSFDDFD